MLDEKVKVIFQSRLKVPATIFWSETIVGYIYIGNKTVEKKIVQKEKRFRPDVI